MKRLATYIVACLGIFATAVAAHLAILGPVDHTSFLAGVVAVNFYLLVVND